MLNISAAAIVAAFAILALAPQAEARMVWSCVRTSPFTSACGWVLVQSRAYYGPPNDGIYYPVQRGQQGYTARPSFGLSR